MQWGILYLLRRSFSPAPHKLRYKFTIALSSNISLLPGQRTPQLCIALDDRRRDVRTRSWTCHTTLLRLHHLWIQGCLHTLAYKSPCRERDLKGGLPFLERGVALRLGVSSVQISDMMTTQVLPLALVAGNVVLL